MKAAADAIVKARRTYVLGVGQNNTNARNFTYLADMAVDTIEAIPRHGSVAADDLARAGKGDVLIAMTCKPYRSPKWSTRLRIAKEQGVTIIGISDSPGLADRRSAAITLSSSTRTRRSSSPRRCR